MSKKLISSSRMFAILMAILLLKVFLTGNLLITVSATWSDTITVNTVNDHAGYTTEWRGEGPLDKPVVILLGYDPEDDDTALQATIDYENLIADMNSRGYDIIIFDYLDGDADIRLNAENIAHFIRYLDDRMTQEGVVDNDADGHPDYTLALAGASMGGIVTRTMFVQEQENMGVNIFVTLDSPHYGVYLSNYIDNIAQLGLDNPAGKQMVHGTAEYEELYGWLQDSEFSTDFKQSVIDPMSTQAIALSDGESRWEVSAFTEAFHTKYHPVASYIVASDLESDFIPYHSAVYMDNFDTTFYRGVSRGYEYKDTSTSYFDEKVQNPRDLHGGPEYMVSQAMEFVELSWF